MDSNVNGCTVCFLMQQPYDYLALVPVVEGAGGKITNWNGESLKWLPEIGTVSFLTGMH